MSRSVQKPTFARMSCTRLIVASLTLLLAPLLAGSALGQDSAPPRRAQAPVGSTMAASEVSQPSADPIPAPAPASKKAAAATLAEEGGPVATGWDAQFESLRLALVRLPVAAVLSAILAFRPRRRGTPTLQAHVIQTQIILAVVGAIVMLVVGASLARAFGIVGAAGLIRYRAKIADPKDAGVMLTTLGIGLASGVGLYLLAVFATIFVLGVLWLIESLEAEPYSVFNLTVAVKNPAEIRPSIEGVLRRIRIPFELRSTSAEEVCYEVKVPTNRKTDSISSAISQVDPKQSLDIKWEKKKEKE
jgi:Domain of unknown function (DUF4956)